MPVIRPYSHESDLEAGFRIWLEVGWIQKEKKAIFEGFAKPCRGFVAELHGEAECLVLTTPGTLRYLNEEISFAACAAVTTSRVGRKQGLAQRVTARAIAEDAMQGASVSGLSCFEQGFYDMLGYGMGGYHNRFCFDPTQLCLPKRARPPRRLSISNAEAMHQLRLNRLRLHGSCNLTALEMTKVELQYADNGFGLGYFDNEGESLSHFVWMDTDDVERGPYKAQLLVYQNTEQFLELMGVIQMLGDQTPLVKMSEPPGVQLQDLLIKPFRNRNISKSSQFEASCHAAAYTQWRICNLRACLAQTHLHCAPLRFNLELDDPIHRFLDADSEWKGDGGQWVVTLGSESEASPGNEAGLPTLKASIGAFTRMWLGFLPASGLTITDNLSAPPDLLAKLDRAFTLPKPHCDWDF